MATGNISNTDSTASLLNLIGAFKGGSSSQTTTPNISGAGMNAVLQQILGSANGLAAVSSQGRNSGLYNSSTQQLLNNDYITRSAGELAKQQAGSTTTTKKDPTISKNNALMTLGLIAGKSVLGPTVSGFAKKLGVDNIGDKVANGLGVGADSSAGVVAGNVAPSPDAGAMDLFSGFGGASDALADVGSSLTVDTAGAGIDAAGSGFSAAADTGLVDAGEEEGGSFLSSLFGG